MTDLKKRLRMMEQVDAPDLWDDIERRRPAPQPDAHESRWRRVGIVVGALVIAVAALALTMTAFLGGGDQPISSPTIAPPLARNGVIAYGSIAHEGLFWTVNPDGSNRTTVHVDVPGFVGVPSWSPDGTRIAFTLQSNDDPHPEGGNYDIYVANADGSNPVRLTRDRTDRGPVWSPDGTRIAYVQESTNLALGQLQIWVMNADGSDPELLTHGGDAASPSWSPDGSEIAFVAWDGSDANIHVMNSDGSNDRVLTSDPSHEDSPAWAPDGRLIGFTSEGGSRDPGIYAVAPDRAGVVELLSDSDPANLGFAWSPDAASMAVVSIRGPGFDRTLYVLDIATGELTAIADPGAYFGPSWQPLPGPNATPTSSAVEPTITKAAVSDVVDVGPATAVAYGEGSVWVAAHPANGPSSILRIDPATDEVIATIQTPVVPTWEVGGGGMVVAEGSVWVTGSEAGGGEIIRIDPATNRVAQTLEVPDGRIADVAVSSDGIWALVNGTSGESKVVRIDRTSGRSIAAIPLSGGYGRSIFAGEGWVLAALTQPSQGVASGGSLVQIDPATNQADGVFDLGTYPSVAEGDAAVWATTSGGLVQIDPRTAQPMGSLATAGCSGDALAVGAGGVWCFDPSRDRALMRFNPATGGVDVVGVRSGSGTGTGGLALVTSPDSVWVIDGVDLVRVDLN